MAEQPAGTLTLLFSDIEGSTRLLEQLGRTRYAEALARHCEILRAALTAYNGYEVDYEGDAFFFVFRSAADAVAAAVDAQRELASEEWPGGHPVRVRMGLHTGEPLLQPPKYVGLDVHRAARIMATGHGGQVLLSARTAGLIEDELSHDLLLVDLGEHRLKDLSRSQRLYQLQIADLPAEFPALRTEIGPVPSSSAASVWGRSLGAPHSNRRLLIAIGAALLGIAVLAGGTTFALRSANKSSRAPSHRATGAGAAAPIGTARAPVSVGKEPTTIAAAGGSLWVGNAGDATLSEINTRSGKLAGKPLHGLPLVAALAGGKDLWAASMFSGVLLRIAPGSRRLTARIHVGKFEEGRYVTFPYDVAVGDNAVWAAVGRQVKKGDTWVTKNYRRLVRVDAETQRVVGPQIDDVGGPIAFGGGAVWATGFGKLRGSIVRIDPLTNRVVDTVRVDGDPLDIAAGAGAVWVSLKGGTAVEGRVARIDTRSDAVVGSVPVDRGTVSLALGKGVLWAASLDSGLVTAISTTTTRPLGSVRFAAALPKAYSNTDTAVAVDGGDVWVVNGNDNTVTRIDATPATKVVLTQTEFKVLLSRTRFTQGIYAFEVKNAGTIDHALQIQGPGVDVSTGTVHPGKKSTLTVELRAGTYELLCPEDDHAARGEDVSIRVT
jgi:class 3 adenylate cyclase/DNA-binding beta-propeller fold protein YncE